MGDNNDEYGGRNIIFIFINFSWEFVFCCCFYEIENYQEECKDLKIQIYCFH